MCQNVNIIVQIWSPNLAMCAIAKTGGCTQLIVTSLALMLAHVNPLRSNLENQIYMSEHIDTTT